MLTLSYKYLLLVDPKRICMQIFIIEIFYSDDTKSGDAADEEMIKNDFPNVIDVDEAKNNDQYAGENDFMIKWLINLYQCAQSDEFFNVCWKALILRHSFSGFCYWDGLSGSNIEVHPLDAT